MNPDYRSVGAGVSIVLLAWIAGTLPCSAVRAADEDAPPGAPFVTSFHTDANGAGCFAFNHNGKQLATGGWTGRDDDFESWKNGTSTGALRIWDVISGKELASFEGDFGAVFDVAFAPDGTHVYTGGRVLDSPDRGLVTIWNLQTKQPVKKLLGHTRWVLGLAVSSDGRLIASGSFDRTVRIWDAATGDRVAVLRHPSTPDNLSFSSDGTTLMAGCRGGQVVLWETNSWKERGTFTTAGIYLQGADLSRDGKRFAVVGPRSEADGTVHLQEPGTMRLLSAADGSELGAWRPENGSSSVAFSPDGRFLADVNFRYSSVWDLETRKEVIRIERGSATSEDRVRFSPDGKTLAISDSRSVRLLDVSTLPQPDGKNRP